MDHSIFDHLLFARRATLHYVKELSESQANFIPERFNNNIRWNLGHIYLVHEQLAFMEAPTSRKIPEGFTELFAMGTRPLDRTNEEFTLNELIELLKEQPQRIEQELKGRLNEKVEKPFLLPGLQLEAIGEFLSFAFYHESGHTQSIKMIKRFMD